MMKRAGLKWITAIFLVGVFPVQLNAQEVTFGSGVMASKCSKLLSGISESDGLRHPLAFAMLSWTEGYITATNLSMKDEGDLKFDLGSMTSTEIWASIYGFCKRNPNELGIAAAIETMRKLNRVEVE